jgi:hypothetical protein
MILPPEIKGALEVAIIVRNLSDIRVAVDIIEQYARLVASGARLDATMEEFNRIQDRVAGEMANAQA